MKGESWLARVAALGAAIAVAVAGLYRGNNPDTFGHLAQGRQIARLGHVPPLDTWSLLPGPARPWHNYEWLSDLGTWVLYDRFGSGAVTLCKCMLLAIAVLALSRTAALVAGPRAVLCTSLALVSTLPAIRTRLSDRPHILGICLAALSLMLLTQLALAADKREARARCAAIVASLFALHLLWVNTHGSHLLGLAIAGSFLALGTHGARAWVAAVVGLALLASCISPYGPAITFDAIDHVVDARYRNLVSEWQPWQDHDPAWLQLGPVLHGAALALLLPRLLRSSPLLRPTLPIALLLAGACFRSIRFLAEFMLLTAPLIGTGVASMLATRDSKVFGKTSAVAALLLVGLVPWGIRQLPPHQGIGLGISYAGTPRAAGELLAKHAPAPRVFAAMQDSWFTMFAAPQSRFVIDGRVPFYGPDYVTRVGQAFASERAFDSLTRELDVNVVIAGHAAAGEQQLDAYVARAQAYGLVMIEDLQATYARDGALDPAYTRENPPLRVLRPGYDIGWLLALDGSQHEALTGELARLARHTGTSGYRGWVQGLLALAPLKRGGPSDGFRWPRSPSEWRRYQYARPLIAEADRRAPDVPVVAAMHAAISAVFCDFEAAEGAVERAMKEQASRQPLLVAQEIALRRGRVDQVRKVLRAVHAAPQSAGDPWLHELSEGLKRPPSCPQ